MVGRDGFPHVVIRIGSHNRAVRGDNEKVRISVRTAYRSQRLPEVPKDFRAIRMRTFVIRQRRQIVDTVGDLRFQDERLHHLLLRVKPDQESHHIGGKNGLQLGRQHVFHCPFDGNMRTDTDEGQHDGRNHGRPDAALQSAFHAGVFLDERVGARPTG